MEKFILKYFTLIRTIIAILIGIIITVILIYVISKMPDYSLTQFFLGPFHSKGRLANVFENASPMIFCGIAIAVAFQAKQLISALRERCFSVPPSARRLAYLPGCRCSFTFRWC